MFDGTVARMCKRSDREKKFGIQIDSLSDLIAFGEWYSKGDSMTYMLICFVLVIFTLIVTSFFKLLYPTILFNAIGVH